MPPLVRTPAPQSYRVWALDRRCRPKSLQEMTCAHSTAHSAGTSGCCRTPGEASPSPYRFEHISTFIIFNKCGENKMCIWGWSSMVLRQFGPTISWGKILLSDKKKAESLQQFSSCAFWVIFNLTTAARKGSESETIPRTIQNQSSAHPHTTGILTQPVSTCPPKRWHILMSTSRPRP